MTDFLAWLLLITVVAMWALTPWREEEVLRLFNAPSYEDLFRRWGQNRRFIATVGLVFVLDIAAVALALIVLI